MVPFVALSRIYYQCHYIGDTIVGAFLGILYATLAYDQFHIVEPMFRIFLIWFYIAVLISFNDKTILNC
jgi:membrane-associated phospholipid phosphatase